MAINKVIYGDQTLLDLTDDTVSSDTMLYGTRAHDRSGEVIEGTVIIPEPAIASPLDLGEAAVGTSLKYAREDHVHPMPSASDIGLADNQIRAIKIGTSTPTTSDISDGEIYLKYTPR